MFKKLLKRTKKFVGAYFDAERINVAVVEWNGKLSICNLSSVEIPEHSSDGLNSSNDSNLVLALNKVMDEAGVTNEKINFAIGGQHVSLRHIKFPNMPKRELDKAVKWEVERLFPDLSQKLTYRYLILGKIAINEIVYYNILLITVDKDLVEKYHRIFQSVGLKLAVFDIPELALWSLYKKDKSRNVALMYFDTGIVHNIFMNSNQIYYIRNLPEYDINNLVSQLDYTIRYQEKYFPIPLIKNFILGGNVSKYQGIEDFIEKKMNVPVNVYNPEILAQTKLCKTGFEVAIGLALRRVKYV